MRKVSIGQNTTKPFTMWMMEVEDRQAHAESIRCLVIIEIPNLLGGSVDTPRSVRFFKSSLMLSWPIWNWDTDTFNIKRRIKFLDFIFRGLISYGDESCRDQDNSPENCEMVSATSVGGPHAVISSIDETDASKPQAHSSLMNYPSAEVIQIDERRWNDIPAYGIVGRKSLEWTS